jgi:beta-lactamase superfamily II metal-dependent hydrolase
MKISFKNVGQGDSIVLEWQSKGVPKFGVIDCNRYQGGNPVVEHLKLNEVKELSFIFLTHPHVDHFSGMIELLDHCLDNNIQIRRFVHTLRSDPRLIRSLDRANVKAEDSMQLHALFKKLQDLYTRKVIVEMGNAEVDWSIVLNESWTLRNLSPTEKIMSVYLAQAERYRNTDLAKCGSLANLLSAILCLEGPNETQALLTADAEIEALGHILDRISELFEGKLVLAQIPHHGSASNHSPVFWNSFAKMPQCPAVVSAGENKKYKHPDLEVIAYFEASGFQVHATNDVHGFRENRLNKELLKLSRILDEVSEIVEPFVDGVDQVFVLQDKKMHLASSGP